MEEEDLMLDGNAAAGAAGELFMFELTTARGRCDNCGAIAEMGAVMVFANAPGVVLRCPQCQSVLMRVATNGGRHWLDVRGITWLEIHA
jgi:Zn finger protein HypA/HybF involved in hydrogenase expression